MTVKELRDLLQEVDGDRIVIMASDSEGNHYSPLVDCYDGYAFRSTDIHAGDIDTEDEMPDGKPALLLVPIR